MELYEKGSAQELIYDWLTRKDISFQMQMPQEAKDIFIMDFIVFGQVLSPIYIRIQEEWMDSAHPKSRHEIEKITLTNQGYMVIDIWEEQAQENIDKVMKAAINGEELGPWQ